MTGTYTPITKTLTKATPKIRISDDIVKEWFVEVLFEYAGDAENNLPEWSITYSEIKDVEYMGKTIAEFTKAELIKFIPPIYESHIFNVHYESFISSKTDEKISDFSVDQLS